MTRLIASLLLLVPSTAQAFSVTSACTPQERWHETPESAQAISAQASPIRHFAEALSFRRRARSASEALLAEYAISHALWEGKLPHLAWNGFAVLATRPFTPESKGALLAAIECLNRLQDREPSLQLPRVLEALPALPEPALSEIAGRLLRQEIADPTPDPKRIEKLLAKVHEFDSERRLDRGLWLSRRGDHWHGSAELAQFVETPTPSHLQRYREPARLLLARSLYRLEKYDEAI
ncbi:MAG: hypothetical protein ACXWPM_01270, partial [Bdellovibrionota bacterium]